MSNIIENTQKLSLLKIRKRKPSINEKLENKKKKYNN